jgi:hypothetical protein
MIDFTCPNAIYLGKYNVISLEGIQSTIWGKHIYSFLVLPVFAYVCV